MPANRAFRFGPVALTTLLTTNVLNPNITSVAGPVGFTMNQPYIILRHIRVVNKTVSAATVSLWLGATGGNVAGTEVIWQATSCPANSFLDWYGLLFPRRHNRGRIEAPSATYSRPNASMFPRRHNRGRIEARRRQSCRWARSLFPRRHNRGRIEAPKE